MYSILAVDDERWIRKGIIKMIDREANQIDEIYEAGTVQDAIDLYRRHQPDIVLTDVCFPAENGCTLGEYVYRDNPMVRIVLISAYSEFSYAQNALQFRAANYLLKPVSKEKLNQTITQCVQELDSLHATAENALKDEPPIEDIKYSSQIVRKIVERIGDDCAQRLCLSDLAREYHISETHLSTVFKEATGSSLTNYVSHARIEQACQRILMGKEKLSTIARRVGYEDYQYFVRVFKKVMNQSPSEYQANCLAEREGHGEESSDNC